MADDQLISAQLRLLRRRLPGHLYDEIADGLEETYLAHLHHTPDRTVAARRAVAAFGDADTISAALCASAPWRLGSRILLLLGPLLGGLWAATLIGQHAWAWPLPVPVRVLAGIALLGVLALLLVAQTERHSYRRGRLATLVASATLVALDLGACWVALRYGLPGPLLTVALTASLLRAVAVVDVGARRLVRVP